MKIIKPIPTLIMIQRVPGVVEMYEMLCIVLT